MRPSVPPVRPADLRSAQPYVDAVPSRPRHRIDDADDLQAIQAGGTRVPSFDERPAESAERIAMGLAGRGEWRPRLAIGGENSEFAAGRGPRQADAGDAPLRAVDHEV